MKFSKVALAAGLDGPDFESADGAISLTLEHMTSMEAHLTTQEGAITAAEGKVTSANAKVALANTKLEEANTALAESTDLVSQLTLQLEAAKKAPVGTTAVKNTGAEGADAQTKGGEHPYAESYLKAKKK